MPLSIYAASRVVRLELQLGSARRAYMSNAGGLAPITKLLTPFFQRGLAITVLARLKIAPLIPARTMEFVSVLEDIRLYDIDEAARVLGISRSTLWRLRNEGAGPAPTLLGKRRIGYSRDALTQWVQMRTVAQPAARDLIAA